MSRPNHEVVADALGVAEELGVEEWCVAAGSRNAPIVAALADDSRGRVWNFFDERSAAFFAMGRTVESGAPCAVVVTSGTAAAELLPAVVEAHYSRRPLVVLTADRPARFAGTGAPQTIEQLELYGSYVQWTADLGIGEPGKVEWLEPRGPVHLNVRLEEPRPEDPISSPAPRSTRDTAGTEVGKEATPEDLHELESWAGEEVLLLAGALSPTEGAALGELARVLGVAVWSEATSHTDAGDLEVPCPEKVLADPELRPRKVVRFGGVPTCRFWRDLEELPEIEVLVVGRDSMPGLGREQRPRRMSAEPGDLLRALGVRDVPDFSSLPAVCRAGQRMVPALDDLLEAHPKSEPAMVRDLSRLVPPDDLLFLGNSLPIRLWNLVAPRAAHRRVAANRGANGIDGAISTFYGLAADRPGTALIGDLTALYDLSAPWILDQLEPHRRTMVIVNNGGGRIFSRLPSITSLPEESQALVENRHRIGLEKFAALWGVPWTDKLPGRDGALADGVLELRPDNRQSEAFWSGWGEISVPPRAD